MIVKVIRPNVTRLIECDEVKIRSFEDNDEELILEFSNDLNLSINKKNSEVYFMNDDGETIDYYRWIE